MECSPLSPRCRTPPAGQAVRCGSCGVCALGEGNLARSPELDPRAPLALASVAGLCLLSENASSLSTATTSSLARYPPVGTVAVTRGAACRPPHRVLRFRPPVVGGMIGEASRAVKRRIGTTAWAVLEDVALNASLHDGRWVASTSVRQVATHLGLTPGTVARALACLCAAGLVQGEDRRDANTGRFSRSVYRLAPTSALSPCTDSPHTADPAMACEASERHEGREHAPPASTRTSTEPSTPL